MCEKKEIVRFFRWSRTFGMQPVHTIQNIISIIATQRQIISLCVISFSIKFYSAILLTERQTLDWDGHSSAKNATKTVESRSMTQSLDQFLSFDHPVWILRAVCAVIFSFFDCELKTSVFVYYWLFLVVIKSDLDGFRFHSHFECAYGTILWILQFCGRLGMENNNTSSNMKNDSQMGANWKFSFRFGIRAIEIFWWQLLCDKWWHLTRKLI